MHLRTLAPLAATALTALGALAAVTACSSSSSNLAVIEDGGASGTEGGTTPPPRADASAIPLTPGVDPLLGCTRDPGAPAGTVDENSATDPAGGAAAFTLAMAMAGFPAGTGKLTVAISTEKSAIKCELNEAAAPISVANFVGLARGTRPFKAAGKWKLGRFYDGLTWHRVIPDFMIQGGDPDGNGRGGPGYDMVPENHVDEPLGTLAMAAGTRPSGSQFFIVVGKGPAPEYNVFGTCTTENAVLIANVETDANDRPETPVHMVKVDIARCP